MKRATENEKKNEKKILFCVTDNMWNDDNNYSNNIIIII